jgi:putative transposase
MKDRAVSGLNVKEFCRSAGFHENVYYYWQRKLREAACRELLPPASSTEANTVTPSGWALCGPAKAAHPESSVFIEIGGCRVAVGAGSSAEALEKACRVLMSLC